LKPKDVRDKGISQQALYYQKSQIKNGKTLNIKQKIVRKLLNLYKDRKLTLKITASETPQLSPSL